MDRSVIFMTFSGEERGLLGSQYFVSHPLVPLDKVVAMLNLDMVGRLRNDSLDVGPSGIGKEMDALMQKADQGLPIKLKPMGRFAMAQWASDHTSFAIHKIPVLFLFTGLHADYHRPSDTSDKINYQGMAAIAELSARIIRELTETPRDVLAKSELNLSPMMPGQGHGAATSGGASLGVVPDYGSDASAVGVLIVGTSPGSAADKAGLKAGDRITALGGKKVEDLQQLADVLSEAKPGDQVKVKIVRDKQELTLDATLGQRH
jgi:membrane-associated protease RseP (regulator of RpoE activity)